MTTIDFPMEIARKVAPSNGARVRVQEAPNVFVIPAYNEEPNLPRLFVDLEARPELFPDGSRVIIVDDGSRDRTGPIVTEYAGDLPLELLSLGVNQGPGAAFRAGFAAAL